MMCASRHACCSGYRSTFRDAHPTRVEEDMGAADDHHAQAGSRPFRVASTARPFSVRPYHSAEHRRARRRSSPASWALPTWTRLPCARLAASPVAIAGSTCRARRTASLPTALSSRCVARAATQGSPLPCRTRLLRRETQCGVRGLRCRRSGRRFPWAMERGSLRRSTRRRSHGSTHTFLGLCGVMVFHDPPRLWRTVHCRYYHAQGFLRAEGLPEDALASGLDSMSAMALGVLKNTNDWVRVPCKCLLRMSLLRCVCSCTAMPLDRSRMATTNAKPQSL